MNEENTENLARRREVARKKFYVLAFEIFVIFGLPAAAAFFLGKYLIDAYGFGRSAQALLLIPAFVLSWVIFIIKFKKISREISDLNDKINKKP